MQGTNHVMMRQVMDELAVLYRNDEVSLAQQFVWMNLLLERTTTIAPAEKVAIRRELSMYERLLKENPAIQQLLAESKAEGEIEASRRMLINIVKARFPALAELAEQKVTKINKPDALNMLAQQIFVAPDEHMVRWLLTSPVA